MADFTEEEVDRMAGIRPAVREHFGRLLDDLTEAVESLTNEHHAGFSWNFKEKEEAVATCRKTLEEFIEVLI